MTNTLLVTGASTGLGVSIAIQAAQAGYKVYATMRNLEKRAALDNAADTAGVELQVMALDVEDVNTIESCVQTIVDADGGIDVLVNNAGVGYVRSTEQASHADLQWVVNVNLMGVMRCTKAVLPHMRAAGKGHVVAISSVGGLVGQPFNEVYCATKFAVEGYIESLASYVGPAFGLHFSAIEPGGIVSEFANNAMKHLVSTGGILEDAYKPIVEKYMAGAQARGLSAFQTSDAVAQVVMDCIQADQPPVRVRTSAWAEELCELKTASDSDGLLLQKKVVDLFLGGLG